MKRKFFVFAVLAASLLLALTACEKTKSHDTSEKADSEVEQIEQDNDVETSYNEDASVNEDKSPDDKTWKENFEKRLFEEYGLTPEYYEDLGNGIYQVYVKKGDNIVPFVTVDSATGDYHG